MKLKVMIVLISVIVIAGGLIGYHLISQSGQSTLKSEVQVLQKHESPLPTPSVAHTTTQAFSSPTGPLAKVGSVGEGLLTNHDATACRVAEATLSQLGSPEQLRAIAASLQDPVAEDLSQSVVTAEIAVLGSCRTSGIASASSVAMLQRALLSLTVRLKEDGLHAPL